MPTVQAKQTATARKFSEHRPKNTTGFISIDVMVLTVTPSLQGNIYLYDCIDHATRMVFGYSTNDNSANTTQAVLHSLKMDCAELGFEIQHVKSDRGEILSQQVLSYIADQGYSWTLSSFS